MAWTDTVNEKVARSRVGRYFQLEGSGHKRERKGTRFMTELRAGATTFFAMVIISLCITYFLLNWTCFFVYRMQAYILSVNGSIISESGGSCVCDSTPDDPTCDNNVDYMNCVFEVKLEMIMATAILSMIACVLIGLFANLPLGLAPG